ncbi:uncharacterized protein LOC109602693 isoform X3 [Aethina tumida]|uniref:uncharacterized protein LOC109602693 isoform X3 n=1 Tax=Aethina tumida TaxID=116153 RepID=UPI0021482A72|nr:uncharacterized protein LOC109602693 isoform X3 [Aethina tumida]
MLKWTAMAKRESTDKAEPRPSGATTPRKSKRRRSSVARRRSSIRRDSMEENKENQFTSTPIKSSEGLVPFDVLRDVSNLTPTDDNRRELSAKKCKSERKSPSCRLLKKKKTCLNVHNQINVDSQCSNFFRPFEAVDSHIEGILADVPKAPTLPVCPLKSTQCLNRASLNEVNEEHANKKAKIDHVNDFLSQISLVTSSEDKSHFPGLKSTKNIFHNEVKMSPLVKKFIDLRFSKISLCPKQKQNNNVHEDSSYINDLSLDQIVDAILETSYDSAPKEPSLNTSIMVNPNETEKENDLNETHEENMINIEHERQRRNSFDGSSTDSGFRSSTAENSHQLDSNYLCKCNNNNKNSLSSGNIVCDKTIINVNETFNERCVDDESRLRKRSSDTTIEYEQPSKRLNLDQSVEGSFSLKRQKCIRRKLKPFLTRDAIVHDESFNNCYMENKEIQVQDGNRIRRCLLFDSPKLDDSSCLSDNSTAITDVRGSLDLNIHEEGDALVVHIIRCKDLFRPNGKVNAYVKAAIGDNLGSSRRKLSGGTLQRTAVQADSTRPLFNHTFRFLRPPDQQNRRVHIEVWHRDRTSRTSELLGCMSFDVGDACRAGISGSYRLLPQSTGRQHNVPITHPPTASPTMCESQSSVEEVIQLDDLDPELKKPTNKTVLVEQQKHADENLFLRYLELDPTEGPDAIPAATQRKASGNKCGRTPFTQTKRLIRQPKAGFGFSVVWTHPPRVERVEKGLPADKAGILPGDYIIFVDKHNVVMTPEIDILNLIRACKCQLTLEIFRRSSSKNGSVPSVKRLVTPSTTSTHSSTTSTNANTTTNINLALMGSNATLPQLSVTQRRPSTVCSTNTTSVDYSRRKLHLPQVTFSSEKQVNNPEEHRDKIIYQLISKEQTYSTALQFGVTRFVSALAERKDLLTAQEHKQLFQNVEDILRLTEDILDHVIGEDGEPSVLAVIPTYQSKVHEITTAYKRYCTGIKRADCVLAGKMKNANSEFTRVVQTPAVPRRRPDITLFIHKPLEHYREVLKMLTMVQSSTKPSHDDYAVINQIIHDLQTTYREICSEAGLMEPTGEGRPLLTVQDLENRLVFTKCKPFVLSKPGRQWIFGGDLGRVEGRNVRQYWTLLFSDLLLFAKVSRDRVLFIIEEPLPLSHVTDMFFNVRKKETEFRITISPEGRNATSPTVHCGPDLSRTPRKNANKRTVILRAPTAELKAVWQNLLQRQIFHINAGMDGSSYSSPIESPTDAPITSSIVTLQSAESLSPRQRQTPQNLIQIQNETKEIQKELDCLIEMKCKQLSKSSFNSKCNAIHLEKWMKGELLEPPYVEPDEPDGVEEWTEEMVMNRSRELNLLDCQGNLVMAHGGETCRRSETRCEEYTVSEHSPSKSTTTESQNQNPEDVVDDWQQMFLLGMCPAATLLQRDPFETVPKISVMPATPESSVKTMTSERVKDEQPTSCKCQMRNSKPQINSIDLSNEVDVSPDDSPQTEEHPYRSLSSSVTTLRRFGTVASLERVGSEDHDDPNDSERSSDNESDEDHGGIDNEAFNHTMSWTEKAGTFVAEKMAFFERLGQDYTGGRLFERYLKTTDTQMNGDDAQEEETSGATSGEEIWGTPTSGGELDDSLTSPNYEGKQSPNDGSISSDGGEDTELMMDELLMTPPITGAIIRGLLPRRTLEPLIEEDCSETSSSSDATSQTEPSLSPEQDSGTGVVADTCSTAAEGRRRGATPSPTASGTGTGSSGGRTTTPTPPPQQETPKPASSTSVEAQGRIHRADSYRRIIEAAEEGDDADNICFFSRFKPAMSYGHIQRVPRSRSVRIFEFFNVRRAERRIYETYPEDKHLLKLFNDQDCVTDDDQQVKYSDKPISSRRIEDKRLDKRFWRQLSRRRSTHKGNIPA